MQDFFHEQYGVWRHWRSLYVNMVQFWVSLCRTGQWLETAPTRWSVESSGTMIQSHRYTPEKLTAETPKLWRFGWLRWFSVSKGWFSGSMLVLLMEEIRRSPPGMYKTLYINTFFAATSTGAGFLPSTVGYIFNLNWWMPEFWSINSRMFGELQLQGLFEVNNALGVFIPSQCM